MELLERIGSGSYGEVWLARNAATGARRAVKIVYRATFTDERPFHREFEGIKKFESISHSHPSQLSLFQVGRNDEAGYFYYVMELADSVANSASYQARTLRSELSQGRLPAARALEIALALTEALAHLHANGLIHRDVKPSNIIFVNGRPKLADIGLVTDASDSRSVVGTEGYLAPEGPGSAAADIFALGKVLYEALTGLDRRRFPELPADIRSWPDAKLAFELNTVILKTCAAQPRERYASADALLADLKHLHSGKSIQRLRSRHRAWSFGWKSAVVLGVISGIVWIYFLNRDRSLDIWRDKNLPYEAFENSGTTNFAAWEADQRGKQTIIRYDARSMSNAVREFERAIELDPNFARGYSILAIALVLSVDYGYLPASNALPRAQACIQKTLEIEPNYGFVYSTLGELTLALDYDFSAAERLYRKSFKLVPQKVSADQNFARLLTYVGRSNEAEQLLDGVTALNPRNGLAYVFQARLYAAAGRTQEALAKLDAATRLMSGPLPYLTRADILAGLNDRASVASDLLQVVELDGFAALHPQVDGERLRRTLEDRGSEDFLRLHIQILEERRRAGRFVSAYDMARLHAHAGNRERTLDFLEDAVGEHRCMTLGLKINPLFKNFQGEPRFEAVLVRLNLSGQ